MTIADAFVVAWNSDDDAALAALFTDDSTYIDRAVGGEVHGRAGVIAWKTRTVALIADLHVQLLDAWRTDDREAVETVYSGQIRSATRPFAVPAASLMRLRDERIVTNTDYYNLADLLTQSGLPPTWTPTDS